MLLYTFQQINLSWSFFHSLNVVPGVNEMPCLHGCLSLGTWETVTHLLGCSFYSVLGFSPGQITSRGFCVLEQHLRLGHPSVHSSIHPPALEWHRVLIKSMVSWAPFLLALAMDVKPAAFPAAAVLVNEATLGWEPYVNKGWGRRQEEPGSLTTERWIAYLRLNLGDRKWISFLSNHLDFLLCK